MVNAVMSQLAAGSYLLGVRVRDAVEGWGLASFQFINVMDSSHSTVNPDPRPALVQAEYFFNTDPGPGLATPLLTPLLGDTALSLTNHPLVVPPLAPGVYVMGVRVRDARGLWGICTYQSIYIQSPMPPAVVTQPIPMVAAEYFFGADPGCGRGTPFPVQPGTGIDAVHSVSLVGLVTGSHVLSIRTRDLFGRWSVSRSTMVQVVPTTCSPAQPDFVSGVAQPGVPVLLSSTSTGVDSSTTYGWYVGDVSGISGSLVCDFEQGSQGWDVSNRFAFAGSTVLGPFMNQTVTLGDSG